MGGRRYGGHKGTYLSISASEYWANSCGKKSNSCFSICWVASIDEVVLSETGGGYVEAMGVHGCL